MFAPPPPTPSCAQHIVALRPSAYIEKYLVPYISSIWIDISLKRQHVLFFKPVISITFYPFAQQESKPPRRAVARCWRLYHFNAFALEDRWRSGQMVVVKIPGLVDFGSLPCVTGKGKL